MRCLGRVKRGRVLTLQGHLEFENNILIDFGKPILGKDALHEITDGLDDYAYAARAILKFFQGEEAEEKVTEGEMTGGEVTKGMQSGSSSHYLRRYPFVGVRRCWAVTRGRSGVSGRVYAEDSVFVWLGRFDKGTMRLRFGAVCRALYCLFRMRAMTQLTSLDFYKYHYENKNSFLSGYCSPNIDIGQVNHSRRIFNDRNPCKKGQWVK